MEEINHHKSVTILFFIEYEAKLLEQETGSNLWFL